jgi:CRISPR/Cas system-associated exonuclease Cas4 (RecB family)
MTDALKQGDFRPSNLDKLAECSWFRSTPGGSEATARGTQIDLAFRSHFLTNPKASEPHCLADEDKPAVEWAVEKVRELAGGATVITDKDGCKVDIPHFDRPGEVDALVSEKYMHIDVKSGQKHDYKLQQAAYASGLMDCFFTNHWTAFILYCDLREIECLTFNYNQVDQTIERAKEEYNAPKEPVVNEFCGWCANFEQCPTQRQLASSALALVGDEDKFERVKADPQRLGWFLDGCKAVKEFKERATEHAKLEMLKGNVGAEGWKLTNRRGSEYVSVVEALKHLPAEAILGTLNTITKGQYEMACALRNVVPNPKIMQQSGGSYYLRQKPKPKQKEIN